MVIELMGPAFIAGLLMFLAPCTLPLVPGYLGFISGVTAKDLQDPERSGGARWRIFWNGLWYVVGFSVVFVGLGMLAGLGGHYLMPYRLVLGRLGGLFVMMFGLYMLGVVRWPAVWQGKGKGLAWSRNLKPGKAGSSLLFGATFALGWTPCVGPILGSILVLAATAATVGQGAVLLLIFSLGMGLPFLGLAAGFGWVAPRLVRFQSVLRGVSVVGGVFLVFIGILLVTDSMGIWVSWFFRLFGGFRDQEWLLDYL